MWIKSWTSLVVSVFWQILTSKIVPPYCRVSWSCAIMPDFLSWTNMPDRLNRLKITVQYEQEYKFSERYRRVNRMWSQYVRNIVTVNGKHTTALWSLTIWWTILLSQYVDNYARIRWQYCVFSKIQWTILSIYSDNIVAENTKAGCSHRKCHSKQSLFCQASRFVHTSYA